MPATSHETGQRGPCHRVDDVSAHLNPGGQQFRGDHGAADPRVTAALAAYHAGQGSEQAALGALAAARLLVPVIAVAGHDPNPERHRDQSDKQARGTRTARWCCPR